METVASRHLLESPLNERLKQHLIDVSNEESLKNTVLNLKAELDSFRKQLFGKKELIKEFEDTLQSTQSEQKVRLSQVADLRKMVNLYSMLTATKITVERKEPSTNNMDMDVDQKEQEQPQSKRMSQFLCRTLQKEAESMMEYYLSFGFNEDGDADQDKQIKETFFDYTLVSSHNLAKPLNESLSSNITFYTKDAPLFLKVIIQQMFGK